MARRPTLPDVELKEADREALDRWVQSCGGAGRIALRARIVRLAGLGWGEARIARHLGVGEPTVARWVRSYLAGGLAALLPARRGGAMREIECRHVAAVREALATAGPWTTRTLGERLGLPQTMVSRIIRALALQPDGERYRALCRRVDPLARVDGMAGIFVSGPVGLLFLARSGRPEAAGASAVDVRRLDALEGTPVVQRWSECLSSSQRLTRPDPGRVRQQALVEHLRRVPPGLAGRGFVVLTATAGTGLVPAIRRFLSKDPENALLQVPPGTAFRAIVRRWLAFEAARGTDLAPSLLSLEAGSGGASGGAWFDGSGAGEERDGVKRAPRIRGRSAAGRARAREGAVEGELPAAQSGE